MTALRSSSSDPPRPGSRKLVWALLLVLIVWAFGLRVWYGGVGLNAERFWDERYGLENIASMLRGGGIKPANGFHPSLSYLPQAAILGVSHWLHGVTGDPAYAVFAKQGFTPNTYRLLRLSQAVMGAVSLWLMFLVARRFGGDRVGLMAALLLAVVPWHIRQSAIYKPDILLVLTLLLAFLLSQRAVEAPSLGRYLGAGAAIGLALASKFNAGPIAFPLTIATFARMRGRRRLFLWLVAAGACALGVFLALNPYLVLEPEIYQRSMGKTLRDYAHKGATRGGDSRLYLVYHAVASLTEGSFHGPLVGWLALVALAVALARSLKDRARSAESLQWLMAVSFVVGYVVLYALSTTNPSAHNWLVLSPFLALAAAWALDRGWRWLVPRLPESGRRPVGLGLAALLVLGTTWHANAFSYGVVVPTTGQLAGHLLENRVRDLDGRVYYSEVDLGRGSLKRGRSRSAVAWEENLETIDPEVLDTADGEVLVRDRGAPGLSPEFVEERTARGAAEGAVEVEPGLFHARGPALTVLLHPQPRRGEPVQGLWRRMAPGERTYVTDALGEFEPGDLVSLEFWLPRRGQTVALGTLRLGERRLETVPYDFKKRRVFHTTPRFRVGDADPVLEIGPAAGGSLPPELALIVRRWGGPEAARSAP